jgi:hypothetical protein
MAIGEGEVGEPADRGPSVAVEGEVPVEVPIDPAQADQPAHQGLSFQPSTKPMPKAQQANEIGSSLA